MNVNFSSSKQIVGETSNLYFEGLSVKYIARLIGEPLTD